MLLAAALCAALAYAGYRQAYANAVDARRAADAARLEFHVASLESALAKYEALPPLLAFERALAEALEQPRDAIRIDAANRYLEAVGAAAQVAVAYLLDANGIAIAASNWRTPQSFVGQDYRVRPYFLDALRGRPATFYGVGITTGEPGLFLSAPLVAGGQLRGVVVVKVSLAPIEAAWARAAERVAAADANGVIVLAAEPAWKYRTLAPLSAAAIDRAAATQQYGRHALRPLLPAAARLDGSTAIELDARRLLAQSRGAGPLGWQLLYFSDLREARRGALAVGAALGFAAAFVLSAALYLSLRRRRLRERREARAALERAYEDLERRIAERTQVLTEANADLQRTVRRLEDTERILRETQDQAVQAGRLAVLGQMATGITHEINQPLAALTTLADNSVSLLALDREDDVRENLRLISELARRMGRIAAQLKTFARREPVRLAAVSVADALANALMLIEPVRREAGVTIELPPAEPRFEVAADSTRLEQVLVNLLRNGIEAMETATPRRLEVGVAAHGARVRIAVRDHGPGLPEAVRAHLFEPFYTTKGPGKGLGLGLAISHAIVEGLGGTLSAGNAPDGGAVFTLELDTP